MSEDPLGPAACPVRCDSCKKRFDLRTHPDRCPGCQEKITAVKDAPEDLLPDRWKRPRRERPVRFIPVAQFGQKSPRQIKKILTRPWYDTTRAIPPAPQRWIPAELDSRGGTPIVHLTAREIRELEHFPVHRDGHALLGRELIPYMAALRRSDWDRERDRGIQEHGMIAEARRIRADEEISKAIRWHLQFAKVVDERAAAYFWRTLQLWDDALGVPVPPPEW